MRLDIYVADHCENCQEALRLAELAQTTQGVEVRVINVETTTEIVPTRVVATPMYLLDGHVVAMGNPYSADLSRMLGQPRARNG